jgi:antitoxin component YwqK of YwqJK toxin-antitoxin module
MECYVCYQEENHDNKFVKEDICKCKGSNRIHVSCFQKLLNQNKCSICNSYFENLEEVCEYENGLRVIIELDNLGLKHRYTVNKEKQKHGKYSIYYPNNNIWEEQNYVNGIRHGIQMLYSMDGKQQYMDIYFDGKNIKN